MESCNIIIVDDNRKFRQGLRFYIENILNCQVIGEASNGYELERLENLNQAQIILMDIEMPGLNGLELSKKLLHDNNPLIIAITGYEEDKYIQEMKKTGLKGCVEKRNIYNNLGIAIQEVTNGKTYYPDHCA